jgi:hypothetical protein
MSDDLYRTRLLWVGIRGVAKLDGVERRLTQPPQCLPGVKVDCIDWAPGIHCAMVMPAASGWRHLTAAEIEAVRVWLRAFVNNDKSAP